MRSCSLQTDPTHALPSEQVTAGRASFLSAVDCRREVGTDRVSLRDLRRGANDKGALQTEWSPACHFHPLGAVRVQLQRVGKLRASFRVDTPRTHASVRPERQHRRVLSL